MSNSAYGVVMEVDQEINFHRMWIIDENKNNVDMEPILEKLVSGEIKIYMNHGEFDGGFLPVLFYIQ